MEQTTKIRMFEYAIFKLVEWFKEIEPQKNVTLHFSRLVSLKLLFFISAIKKSSNIGNLDNASRTNESLDLLDIYENFYAMQYGPVEIDIYTAIVTNQTQNYIFGNHSLKGTPNISAFNCLPQNLKDRIDESIIQLREINPNIVSYAPFKLVELSHKWDAWQNAMATAELFGRGRERMSVESIRNSSQFYV